MSESITRDSGDGEQQQKEIPYNKSEEEFETCMGWHGGDERTEYRIRLTIGEMNLLKLAISNFKDKELLQWDEITEDYHAAYGYSKENRDSILSKVKNVQLDIFKNMGKKHIEYTQRHKNLGGTIQ